ncbi:ribonuclease H-like domain-containing protein [Jeotgalibacillus haloalkalitolerans]|uniref:Ribonuclease H-like domain-containing protein n=1 Tax=Jeotgalibacillus haloalkalitolerans TaxID=3104292 RepID=A0ABU5KLM4_9BACL|nr:ribonuclease H-like domain-containing protein [Jeotgalibacillus sp. HH7-29]MDZ5711973.1 ribonuclease H-like domain-containing protein [Jeotgalibacillus sp. HH7-29]
MNLKKKLARMKPHLQENNQKKDIETEELPYMDIWKDNDTEVFTYEDQHCLIREVHYPVDFTHGRYQLSDLLGVLEAWNQTDFNHSLSAKGFRVEDLFFFDTETTGLSGTGTSIFLLGYAKFENNRFVLKQHILTDPSNEIALYLSFLENVNYETLVTFNGKSFDWPQVQSRHTLIRNHVPRLPETGHFDLYHAAKRIWKSSLKSLKLKSLEEEKLGFVREDDIPGYLAPAIYFDFVERKHPEGMLKVLEHNEKDILSLITLYTHISLQLLGTDQNQSSIEKLETGKWFKKEGEQLISEKYLKDSYQMDANPSAAFHLAFEYKKQQQFEQALRLFTISLEKSVPKEQRIAAVEISKIYEHQTKDFEKAYLFAMRAIKALDAENIKEELKQKKLDQIKHRLSRISRKMRGNKLT